jgi:hypothetical protein
VRAFPVQAPEDGISLLNSDGKEVAWIDRRPAGGEGALVAKNWRPRIHAGDRRINSVTSFATPCTWTSTPIAATPNSCCAAKKTSAA